MISFLCLVGVCVVVVVVCCAVLVIQSVIRSVKWSSAMLSTVGEVKLLRMIVRAVVMSCVVFLQL